MLIVGGHEAARALGSTLKRAGVGVRLWAGPVTHPAARSAGLDVDRGQILVDSLSREAELEEVTDAVVMSRSDDFNALAAADLRGDLGNGNVYRFAPDPDEPALLPPAAEVDILGHDELTLAELDRRLADGGRFVLRIVDGGGGAELGREGIPLFVIGSKGDLSAVTDRTSPVPRLGDKVIELIDPDSR